MLPGGLKNERRSRQQLLLKTLNSGRASLFVLLFIYARFRSTLPEELPLPESGRGWKEARQAGRF